MEQYRGELAVLKFSVSPASLEVVKVGRKLLLSNIALGTGLRQSKSHQREAQAACEAANAKSERVNSDANEVVELRKRLEASDVSVKELTAELTAKFK